MFCFISHRSSDQLLSDGRWWMRPAGVYGVFLPFLFFSFYNAFARTPPKIKFFILWAAANGVHRDSLAKSGIFSVISLAHLSGPQTVPRRIQNNPKDPLVKRIKSDSSTDTVIRQLKRLCKELESCIILSRLALVSRLICGISA